MEQVTLQGRGGVQEGPAECLNCALLVATDASAYASGV